MQTNRTYVESFSKKSKQSPWVVTIASPFTSQLIPITIGNGGEVEMGPRLNEVLSIMEKRIDAYPFQFTYHQTELTDSNNYSVKVLGDFIVYLEAGTDTFRSLISKQFLQHGTIAFTNNITERIPYEQASGETSFSTQEVIEEDTSSTDTVRHDSTNNTDYLVITDRMTELNVKDGDTVVITGKIAATGSMASEITNSLQKIEIRYVGLDTPETNGTEEDIKAKNASFANRYDISLEETKGIGIEAKDFIKKAVSGKRLAIDLDTDEEGNLAKDPYDRYVGVIYVLDDEATDVLSNGVEYGVHLNKTLLVARSQTNPLVPLAEPYDYYIDNQGYRRFDVVSWLYELGIRSLENINTDDSIGEAVDGIDSTYGAEEDASFDTSNTVTIKHTESPDNRIDFMKPFDDRQEDLFGEELVTSRVRIGDVALIIPPLSIQTNRVSTLEKVKTLRSKSSIMTKTTGSTSTISLQLYFHDQDAINGKPWDNGHGMTYHMDGLRPLIAQFKKAPFLPIDNEYINNTLGIHDVALVSLNVSTVPGFPNSITATLILSKFEVESYMPHVASLGDVINYPMLRWYYQECMRDSTSPYRTYLKPITEQLNNDFTFSLASEEQLMERKVAIEEMRRLDSPSVLRDKVRNRQTELGKLISDGKAAQIALEQYESYQQAKKDGLIPALDEDGNIAEEDHVTSRNLHNPDAEKAWGAIYGEKSIWDLDDNEGCFIPYETDVFQEAIFNNNASYTLNKARDALYYYPAMEEREAHFADTMHSGVFVFKMYADVNTNHFPSFYEVPEAAEDDADYRMVYVPGDRPELLQRLVTRGYEAVSSVNEKIGEYNEMKNFIDNTEGALEMVDFPIEGMLPISLNVVYENSIVPIQMQQGDSPTLQYLGSQDPYIEVQFEATQEGVERIRELLDEAERYAMEYRLGITSGFLGMSNQLTELFGVTTVMPETVTINTSPGFPGRFLVSMVLCGFNKTQQRMEALEGISPIYGDVDREDRQTGNLDVSKDMAVIEQRMRRMEAYPDMELPEFKELEAALPKIGAGESVDYYWNRNDTRFVDPDFYIATSWTFREYIRKVYTEEHSMHFKDFAGLKMYTSNKGKEPITPASNSALELLNKFDQETPSVGGEFGEGASSIGNQRVRTGHYGEPLNESADVAAIQEWLNSEEAMEPPTYDEWVEWGIGNLNDPRLYSHWIDNVTPKDYQIYEQIYKSIDKWFGGFIYDDSDVSTPAWESVTYASVDDLWRAFYNYMATTNPNLVSEEIEEGELKVINFKEFRPITRERLANYIKSVFYYQSRWEHYRPDKKPRTKFDREAGTYHAGIGMIDIAAHAVDITMAKRLLWDWKYAIEYTIEYLSRIYVKAGAQTDDPALSSRPWDWMVHGFGEGEFSETLETGFYNSVIRVFNERFNSPSTIYATSKSKVDPDIARIRQGLTIHEFEVVLGNKEALLYELEVAGMGAEELEGLKNATQAEIIKAYEEYMREKFAVVEDETASNRDGSSYYGKTYVPSKGAGNANRADEEYSEPWKLYQEYAGLRQVVKDETNRLLNDISPYTLFEEMFTDMIDYDMRGRLARAFPTFQMFIIDEGKWMSNYRLWDNLYGFNAIRSIDVHRSRKISADTAVVTMTNVYSNLTSRPKSNSYGSSEYSFWDNLVMGKPNEYVIEARQDMLESMLLKTGARIHLRMGYGSSVTHLPTVFNGTITELDTSEVVTMIAQGDGLELTNVISADPGDTNKDFWTGIQEPRDLLCELMTSKGNWFKDVINNTFEGKYFKENPLGIQHFGTPAKTPQANVSLNPFNTNYGEAAQNIYSSNGAQTFSQWVYDRTGLADDDDSGKERIPWTWDGFIPSWEPGDEDNVLLSLYGQTVWDVAQTLAYCSPDYIAAVHPYELRSTLFFGKPYWRMAYKYDSHYNWNEENKTWDRVLDLEHRKPYMQFHIMDSNMDIVQNRIKTNADGKNVIIVEYEGGKPTQPIYADYDINFSKQRTGVVNAPLVATSALTNFWKTEKQALYYGMSVLRDEMKDMYQGNLIVLGTPTLKPHDMTYMNDTMHEMNGNFLVKEVTHHFSYETGFITKISPDAVAVNDDKALIAMSNWGATIGMSAASAVLGVATAKYATKKVFKSSLARKAVEFSKAGGTKAIEQSIKQLAKGLPNDDDDVKQFKIAIDWYFNADNDGDKTAARQLMKESVDKLEGKIDQWDKDGRFITDKGKEIKGLGSKTNMKRLVSTTRRMTDSIQDGGKAFKLLRGASVMTRITPLSFIAGLAIEWGVETLLEQWRRNKAMGQAVLILPLRYQGRNYTAGINGHKGLVVGDNEMGKLDAFYSGLGFDGDDDGDLFEYFGTAMNWLSGSDRDYTVEMNDLNNFGD